MSLLPIPYVGQPANSLKMGNGILFVSLKFQEFASDANGLWQRPHTRHFSWFSLSDP